MRQLRVAERFGVCHSTICCVHLLANPHGIGYDTDSVLRYDGTTDDFIDEFVATGSGGLDCFDAGDMSFGPDGNLYVSSSGPSVFSAYSVLRYDGVTGAFIDAAVSSDNCRLQRISDLAFDASGNLYVSSSYRGEVHRFGPIGQAALTVSLSQTYDEPITVDFATMNGSAIDGSDYTGSSGTLTFPVGVTSRTILIPTSQTHITAPSESFFVTLSNPSPNATIADNQGEATILWRFQPTELFADSFENGQWGGKWVEDSQNDWFTSTQRKTDGSYAAEVDGRATDATLTMAQPVDLTLYGGAELTFDWYIESGLDAGEYLALDLFDGTSWQEVAKLSGNIDAENTWHHGVLTIDGNYLVDDFQLRFRAKMSSSTEDANVDNVRLVATSLAGPPNLPPEAFSDSSNTSEDTAVVINVLANDSDPDGDPLQVDSVGAASHGTVVNNGDEGVYTLAEDGVKMEAVKFTSTRTDENNSWVGNNVGYQQSYGQPVDEAIADLDMDPLDDQLLEDLAILVL